MNRIICRLLLPALPLLLAGLPLRADPTPEASPGSEPPPQPPFIKDAPEGSSWTVSITFKHLAPDPNEASHPRHVLKAKQVTKSGNLKREISLYADGKQEQLWFVGSIRLREDTHQHYIEVIDMKTISQPHTQVSRDFDEDAWLAIKYYQGVQPEGKSRCYVFRVDVDVDPNNPRPGTGGRYEAFVDVGTKLPMKAEDLSCTYTYKYEAPPLGPLTLPAAFQQEYDKYLTESKPRGVTRR